MCVEYNTSGTFALILSVDFKLENNFRKNTENASILGMHFHILHNTQNKMSPYLRTRFTTHQDFVCPLHGKCFLYLLATRLQLLSFFAQTYN